MELLWEVTGWAGAAAMLGAYLAVSMGWLQPGRKFQTVNLFGSCAFIINGTLHGAWPSVATNVAWFVISALALYRMREKKPVAAVVVEAPSRAPETGAQLIIPGAPAASVTAAA
ncbi:CBU_0592 family membrane protein [Paenarthrobacter ureafaciens]|uniref:CBU_0592 family membrane protein n=1 Tax=Paenarthrobacter ureafaciens TaxID=37931 RepID=UPI00140D15E1|nr:YgjV family protein [Paenarthrobacter ureafaciens]MCX8456601.1 YgjV family protein [Paenarthrobacter ureafaciens]MCY0974815.1 YgjV family protein [Paenarthrobacter ureafaciens]